MSRWNYPGNCAACGKPTGKGRAKGLCVACYRKYYKSRHPEAVKRYSRAYYRRNKANFNKKIRTKRQDLRRRVVLALGGKCACCGEGTYEFLTIDHIQGDGNKHRKRLGGYQHKVYREIEQEGYPKHKYRILCYNCNCAIGVWGYCPHSRSKVVKSLNT